jgi:hypothetical protein
MRLVTFLLVMTCCIRGFSQYAEVHFPDTVILPPPDEEYEVLGIFPGLEGYVVRYDKFLIRGGNVINSEGMDVLQDMDVKAILSMTPTALTSNLADVYGFEFIKIEIDPVSGLSEEMLDTFLSIMESPSGVAYLHSNTGNTYAGILAMAYRIHIAKWSKEKAMIEFAKLGGSLRDSYYLMEQVFEYKKK